MYALKVSSLLLLVVLAGCARLTLLTADDLAGAIEAARQEQDFRTARYLINATPETHPQYAAIQAQAKALDKQVHDYEKRTHGEVLSLARTGDWRAAHERLEDAESRLPDSEALADTRDTLDERERRVAALATSTLLLAEARWLTEHELQTSTLAGITLGQARRDHRHLMQRREEVRERMLTLGQWFGDKKDWQRTYNLLNLSRQLADEPVDASELEETARRALSSASYRDQQQREKQQRRRASELLAAYNDSRSLSDLLKARDYIKQHGSTLERLDQEVTQICQRELQQGMAEGEKLYAQGEYHAARAEWQRVLPISPEHPELNKKLERVGRVLQSLEALQRD